MSKIYAWKVCEGRYLAADDTFGWYPAPLDEAVLFVSPLGAVTWLADANYRSAEAYGENVTECESVILVTVRASGRVEEGTYDLEC